MATNNTALPPASVEAPKSFFRRRRKLIWTCVIVIAVYGLLSWAFGGQREKVIPIPQILQNADIVNVQPMWYMQGSLQQTTKSFQQVKRELVSSRDKEGYESSYPGRFSFTAVPAGTHFSVLSALNEANHGLSAVDSGTTGVDYYLFQDTSGVQSFIPEVGFADSSHYPETYNFVQYKNGQQSDYVKFEY